MEKTGTVIIGGGQAGLAMSRHLTGAGHEHLVLEKDRIGESWRSGRWDSFTLVTPNWMLQLPGFPYDGDDPDGFLSRTEVIRYLERYTAHFAPPLRLGVEVQSVRSGTGPNSLVVETNSGPIRASNVVVATGLFQKPKLPEYSRHIRPGILQIHSSRYRNPEKLPHGAVLVVGSAQSGCQIAEELYQAGRRVYLCTSGAGRVPRRYRGKDAFYWAERIGMFDKTADMLPSPKARFAGNPHLSGKAGGRTLNLHRFAKDGVMLLGRLTDARDTQIHLAPDLKENLAGADRFDLQFRRAADDYLTRSGMEAPADPEEPELRDGYDAEPTTELDLDAAGVTSIVWACGYSFDFRWIDFPLFDEFGYPVQRRGVTDTPGLYFLGLHFLHTLKSGLFRGVGEDAACIAAHITGREKMDGVNRTG